MVWHLHKGWGPEAATLSEGVGLPRGETGGVMGVRRTVTVESLSQTPSVRQGRGRPGLYVVHAGVRVCPLACVYFWFHAAPLCEVMGIFLCPCLKQVAPAWLALSRRSHGVTPGTDFCRRALHLGTPRGLRSTARSGGCASAILKPPAWEGWSLKVPCASREPGPGTGPQAHSALALPGKSFLIDQPWQL